MTPIFPNSSFVHTPEWLLLKRGRMCRIALRVRYGVFIHPTAGPVLIDTGFGPEVTMGPQRSRALALYNQIFRPKLVELESPIEVLHTMGFTPEDVQIVIVSHFHADHVSGLCQFPNAQFVAHGPSIRAILSRSVWGNLHRGIFPELIPKDFVSRLVDTLKLRLTETPLRLGTGRDVFDDGSVLIVDLPGHAGGHFGVCFPDLIPPLLYALDVQWMRAALMESRIPGFPTKFVADDKIALLVSTQKVARFAAAGGDVVLCHDPESHSLDYVSEVDG